MAKIPIQMPQSKNIPRYGEKSKERIQIESDRNVQTLLKTRLLLTSGLNQLLYKLLSDTNQILKNISDLQDKNYPAITFESIKSEVLPKLREADLKEIERSKGGDAVDELIEEIVENTTKKTRFTAREQLINKLKGISIGSEKAIDDFEIVNEDVLKFDLDISELQKTYFCKDCLLTAAENRFKKGKCSCGKLLNDLSDIQEVTVAKINSNVTKFIEKNMWLEYGVEQLFEDEGYNTQCGYNILGTSGVQHEIDVLAEKKSAGKIICECKTSSLILSDIHVLYSKMSDIGAFRGCIFTTDLEIDSNVRRFANSKNIAVMGSVLETDNDELKRKIHTFEDTFSSIS